MQNSTARYIDSLIRNNATCDNDGYHLFVDDLDNNNCEEAIRNLLNFDKETQNIIKDRIQELINERIDIIYAKDQYDIGKRPFIDNQNGEVSWR